MCSTRSKGMIASCNAWQRERGSAHSTSTVLQSARASSLRCLSESGGGRNLPCRPYLRRVDMWGIVPAAGRGTRIQPLAFSKELLPVGSRTDKGIDRPCAVAEYLVERLILGGADKICFIISPGKSDILEYFGDSYGGAQLAYV